MLQECSSDSGQRRTTHRPHCVPVITSQRWHQTWQRPSTNKPTTSPDRILYNPPARPGPLWRLGLAM